MKQKKKTRTHLFDLSRDFLRVLEARPVDLDNGDDLGDIANELVIAALQTLQILHADGGLTITRSRLDPFQRLLGGHIQVHNQSRLAHEVCHVVEERDVGVVVARLHQLRFGEDLREHGILVDGTILNASFSLPNDLLMLSESLIQQIDLQRE